MWQTDKFRLLITIPPYKNRCQQQTPLSAVILAGGQHPFIRGAGDQHLSPPQQRNLPFSPATPTCPSTPYLISPFYTPIFMACKTFHLSCHLEKTHHLSPPLIIVLSYSFCYLSTYCNCIYKRLYYHYDQFKIYFASYNTYSGL